MGYAFEETVEAFQKLGYAQAAVDHAFKQNKEGNRNYLCSSNAYSKVLSCIVSLFVVVSVCNCSKMQLHSKSQ
jgi:hypothetical protein